MHPFQTQIQALREQHVMQQQILAREFQRLQHEMVKRQQQELQFHLQVICFCLDEILFRRDYWSCQVSVDVVPHLWKLCDYIIFVILELHF